MLDLTEAEPARNGTHDVDDLLAEVDAIIKSAEGNRAKRRTRRLEHWLGQSISDRRLRSLSCGQAWNC